VRNFFAFDSATRQDSRLADTIRDFDRPRRKHFDWLELDSIVELGAETPEQTPDPVHTDFHDVYFVLSHAKQTRTYRHLPDPWPTPKEPLLGSGIYGTGGKVWSYRTAAKVSLSASLQILNDVLTYDLGAATLPVTTIEAKAALPSPAVRPAPTARQRERFEALAAEWRNDTGASSVLQDIVIHPAYQQIIGMGEPGIVLVLEQLSVEPEQWFWALGSMAPEGENPAEEAGSIDEARDLWLVWGREKGYLPDRS
jgi:hypothetical protein